MLDNRLYPRAQPGVILKHLFLVPLPPPPPSLAENKKKSRGNIYSYSDSKLAVLSKARRSYSNTDTEVFERNGLKSTPLRRVISRNSVVLSDFKTQYV